MAGKKTNEAELMEHAKRDAMEAMELAKAKFKEAENSIENSIKEDPVHAAMIAAGVGAAIGAAITLAVMRRQKKK
ncbi:MAG: hypothetical protein WA139_04130 [Candidatus Aenigmatarchaeota archaeon]